MPRIRHKTTGHEVSVPDVKAALPFFPDYEAVKSEAPAEDKPSSGEESTAKTTQRSKS
jgi:hypothetical protein